MKSNAAEQLSVPPSGLDSMDPGVGATHGNTHFSFSLLPGEHHLCSNWQSKLRDPSSFYSLANFTAEAGKVYYFRTRVWTRLDLDPVNSDEGRHLVATSPLVISVPKK